MKLFLATSFVLVLLGILTFTVWYRLHKRQLRRCRHVLEDGSTCGCNPERIGQIYSILQPSGTHPSIDGVKVLAVVLTRCQNTDIVDLAKWEEKYVHGVSRQWKLLTDPKSYNPNIELLMAVTDVVTVAQLMEKIQLPSGKDATSIFASVSQIPDGTPEPLASLLAVILRRRRARSQKEKTGPLPGRHELVSAS